MHLGDIPPCLSPARLADVLEAQVGQLWITLAAGTVFGGGTFELFGVTALGNPLLTQRRQAGHQVDLRGWVGIGTGGVVDKDRRVFFRLTGGVGIVLLDLAYRYTYVSARALKINLLRLGKGLGDLSREL